jgi:hypothetical protein
MDVDEIRRTIQFSECFIGVLQSCCAILGHHARTWLIDQMWEVMIVCVKDSNFTNCTDTQGYHTRMDRIWAHFYTHE